MNVQNAGKFEPGIARVTVRDLPPAARSSLRVGTNDRGMATEALGVTLPETIGARAVSGPLSAHCLGPDEWILTADESEAGRLASQLDELAARVPMSAVEISDREITIVLEGPAVCDLLATGCPIDVAAIPVGGGTRTVFDTAQIVLTREAEDVFHLTVWRSFEPHVRAILGKATRELAAGL